METQKINYKKPLRLSIELLNKESPNFYEIFIGTKKLRENPSKLPALKMKSLNVRTDPKTFVPKSSIAQVLDKEGVLLTKFKNSRYLEFELSFQELSSLKQAIQSGKALYLYIRPKENKNQIFKFQIYNREEITFISKKRGKCKVSELCKCKNNFSGKFCNQKMISLNKFDNVKLDLKNSDLKVFKIPATDLEFYKDQPKIIQTKIKTTCNNNSKISFFLFSKKQNLNLWLNSQLKVKPAHLYCNKKLSINIETKLNQTAYFGKIIFYLLVLANPLEKKALVKIERKLELDLKKVINQNFEKNLNWENHQRSIKEIYQYYEDEDRRRIRYRAQIPHREIAPGDRLFEKYFFYSLAMILVLGIIFVFGFLIRLLILIAKALMHSRPGLPSNFATLDWDLVNHFFPKCKFRALEDDSNKFGHTM